MFFSNPGGLTVGINGGFCSAWLPYPLFRWETPDGKGGTADVVAAFHPGGGPPHSMPVPAPLPP